MAKKGEKNRRRIVAAANELFYRKGFNQTAFSDVAEASGIPKGNFYYYFRSKDELLQAVIAQRIEDGRRMLADWEKEFPDPKARLRRFVRILSNEAHDVARYGCPMGSLNIELAKTQLNLQSSAAEMFDLFLEWLTRQFEALGKRKESRPLALHLLAMTQGVALLANVYRNERFIDIEVERLGTWIDSL